MSFFNRLQKLTTEELKELSVLCGGLSLLVGAVLVLSGSVALPNWKNLSFTAMSQTAILYSAAGTQSYVVPAGVTSLQVHLWGAGGNVTGGATLGSCDGYTIATIGSTPGGAGYTTATIPVTPGETLTVVVGAVNGGGTGAGSGAGAGGGYSGVFRGTPSQANAIVIAGGGGGAGAYVFKVSGDCPYGLGYWGNFPGGHGGGSSGGATTGATGGTQVAGGTGSQAGGALSGGNGTLSYTGGGGAGYWGGGSGTNVPPHYGFGGGGGSGYCSPSLPSCSTLAATVTGVAAMSSLAPSGAGNASKAGAVALLIPNISLSASPQVIATGQNTTLNWAATGVQTNSCNIAGVASGINAEGWVVPANWNNANNTIEVIGGGGGGGGADFLSADGAGGGGGAYSKAVNVTLTPGAYVAYKVGSGGAGGTGGGDVDNGGSAPVAGGVGGDTYFCNSTSNCSSISGSAVIAGAKGGSGGPGGETTSMTQGGQAASGVGSVKYSGGQGGKSYDTSGSVYPGGGGGAAGLNGAGANAHGGSFFELGGNGDAGFGGAGSATRGSPGGNGTEWGSGYGSGGGGAAGAVAEGSPGAAGGLYGAGGGGGNGGQQRAQFGGAGGAGKQGLVVVTYTPSGGSLTRIFLTSAGTPAPSGSVATPALTASTTFTLTCIASPEGIPVSTSTTVTVSPPGLSISASPMGVAPSGTSQISWTANGIRANSCTVSQLTPANIASMFSALGGGDNTNKTTAALSQTGSYTYKLACTPLYTSGTNGILVGSPTTGVAGKYGQAVTFGTSPSYLSPASAITLGSSPWTIATWFSYPLVTGISYNTLTRGSSDHQVIVQRSNMHLGTFNNTGGVFVDSGYVISALSAGWHHLAAVGSGSATSFYIDGALVGTSAFKSATNIVAIGNYQGGAQQWGTIDDFRIYNRALSSDEVATLYQGAHVTTSLLAYWPFDTDTLSGTTFYNLAGGMTSTTTTVTVSADLCTDISGNQTSVPTGCQTPSPSPGICIPPGKTWNGSQCVAVTPPPSGISLSSTRVRKGDTATLNWTVTGMSAGISCSMTPSLPGGMPAWDSLDPWYGTGTTGAIAAPATYTLTCGNGVASTSAATTVTLLPLFQEI